MRYSYPDRHSTDDVAVSRETDCPRHCSRKVSGNRTTHGARRHLESCTDMSPADRSDLPEPHQSQSLLVRIRISRLPCELVSNMVPESSHQRAQGSVGAETFVHTSPLTIRDLPRQDSEEPVRPDWPAIRQHCLRFHVKQSTAELSETLTPTSDTSRADDTLRYGQRCRTKTHLLRRRHTFGRRGQRLLVCSQERKAM